MRPITFTLEATLEIAPADIAARILDLAGWPEFRGFGVIPGVASAEFAARTPGVVGTRIRVVNTDGSRHVEEIVEWDVERRLRLEMSGFSPPLSRLASRFEETWGFARIGGATRVTRSFALHPRSALTRPLLGMISIPLRRAVARHLRRMR